jgi:hypothetical protein
MSEKREFIVGYRRPPEATRFKPGQSGNAKGRPKRLPPDIAAILSEPVPVKAGGKARNMPSFEAALRKLVSGGLKERILAACLEFLKLCDEYRVTLAQPSARHQPLQVIPSTWNQQEWMENFEAYGPPPWPGDRSGLPGS